ncbi:unnamed protein product [Caenorhabditis brenneri]
MSFLDKLDPIAREKYMERCELAYPDFVKKLPKFHSIFWRDKDNIRYYNELLNELNNEKRRSVTYPRILDKVLLILMLIAMLYNSGPQPDMAAYAFLSVIPFLFIFYFVGGEAIQMRKGNRLPLEFQRFYEKLDKFTSMVPSNHNEKLGYQNLKFRMIACLDHHQCTVVRFHRESGKSKCYFFFRTLSFSSLT